MSERDELLVEAQQHVDEARRNLFDFVEAHPEYSGGIAMMQLAMAQIMSGIQATRLEMYKTPPSVDATREAGGDG